MATGTYSPDPAFTGFDGNGNVVPGGLLFTYLAGTSTKVSTFTDVSLGSANTNPIQLDAAGRATIFLTPGVSYKYVFATSTASDPPAGADIYWTRDNIGTVPPFTQNVDVDAVAGENLSAGDCVYISNGAGGDAARTAGRWYKADQNLSFRSATASGFGFTMGAITTGNTGTVRIGGRVTGLSALTVGQLYFTSTTPGAISATFSSAAERPVGQADSTTTLIMLFPATPATLSTIHTDGGIVQGDVGTVAQTWSGLKTFTNGIKDSAYTAFLSGDVTNNTTAMANLTGLSITVVSGLKYAFELVLQMSNSTAADGMKIDFDGGAATMTNFRCSAVLSRETGAIVTLANGVSTALATDINVAAMASTSQHCLRVVGSIEPSSSDTLIPRAAMNALSAGTLTTFRGSWLKLRVMP